MSFNTPLGSARIDSSQIRRKLYLPQDGVNYIGLLIGPRGMFQKKLEGESGCKILIRGKGSQKEGQPPQPDDDDDQHVLIMGDTEDAVEKGVAACNRIINADEETRNMIRKEQLKVAAELSNNMYTSSTDNKASVDESMLTPYGPPSPYAYIVPVPNDCIGLIIGKRGETIKRLQLESGAKIQVAKKEVEETNQRYVFVEGTEDKYNEAKRLIDEVVDEWRRIHRKPEIPRESSPLHQPYQTVPIAKNLIGLLTGESSTDAKFVDSFTTIQDKYGVRIYIPDEPDSSGNIQVQVSGEAADAGTSLMINLLQYVAAMGMPQYGDIPYPDYQQNYGQTTYTTYATHDPYQSTQLPPGGYPNPYGGGYPPHGGAQPGYPGAYPGYGASPFPNAQGSGHSSNPQPGPYGHPNSQPAHNPHSSHQQHPSHQQPAHSSHPQSDQTTQGQPRQDSGQTSQSHEENKSSTQNNKEEKHPLAHQYAEHYSKTLGGDYQYYYDYYVKTYAQPNQQK